MSVSASSNRIQDFSARVMLVNLSQNLDPWITFFQKMNLLTKPMQTILFIIILFLLSYLTMFFCSNLEVT